MSPLERADQRAHDVTTAAQRAMMIVIVGLDLPWWGILLLTVVVVAAQFASFAIIHTQEFGS